jgi:hypothetical protein
MRPSHGKRREEEGHGKARIPAFHLQRLREKLGTADPQHDPSQGAAESDRGSLYDGIARLKPGFSRTALFAGSAASLALNDFFDFFAVFKA